MGRFTPKQTNAKAVSQAAPLPKALIKAPEMPPAFWVLSLCPLAVAEALWDISSHRGLGPHQ